MKTKNSDIAVKIFMVVVAVILVGLIIAWSTGVFKDKRKDLNEGTERINNAISSMVEFDLLAYDGGSIMGSLLVDLINDKERDFNINVLTKENAKKTTPTPTPVVYQKGPSPTPEIDKANTNYINPNGVFLGKVNRNDNGIVESITFIQQ